MHCLDNTRWHTLSHVAFTERSHPARQAILTAARQRFTRDGYERTTIRSVAADAKVDPSMVMRYYRSKDGLFSAAVDVDLHLPDVTGLPLDRIARVLAGHFVNRWEGELADEAIMLLLRSAVTNPAAAERMRTVFARQVVGVVGAALPGSPDAELRAALVSTQLLGVALTRYILQLPPIVALDPDSLINLITPLLDHVLRAGQRA